jgi:hypothetical protein
VRGRLRTLRACRRWVAYSPPSHTITHQLAPIAIDFPSLAPERVHHVHSGDSLSASVLGVGDGVADHVLEEDFEHAPCLFVHQACTFIRPHPPHTDTEKTKGTRRRVVKAWFALVHLCVRARIYNHAKSGKAENDTRYRLNQHCEVSGGQNSCLRIKKEKKKLCTDPTFASLPHADTADELLAW